MQSFLRDLVQEFLGTTSGASLKLRLQARPQLDELEQHEAPAVALFGLGGRPALTPEFNAVPEFLAPTPAEMGIAVATAEARVTAPADFRVAAVQSSQVVFIDPSVAGYGKLAASLDPGVDVVILNGQRDGVRQIADYLASRQGITAVHIVSHGAEGMVRLGSVTLSGVTMSRYAAELRTVAGSLAGTADMLFYGCNVATGPMGAMFVRQLAKVTGADVAASTDATGPAVRGGNWNLERTTGPIEAATPFQQQAQQSLPGVLATVTPGNEFLVRDTTYTGGSGVATLSNGSFVVVWTRSEGFNPGIYAQRYDANGTAQGAEIHVNTVTNWAQTDPSVAALSNGGFVVTWVSQYQESLTKGTGVYAQRYDSSGTPQGSEFHVNTYTSNDQSNPSVAGLSDGGFVVAWSSQSQDGNGIGVYAQQYNSSGVAQGGEFRVNTSTTNNQRISSVAGLSGGGYVISWTSDHVSQSNDEIYAKIYDNNGGVVKDQYLVNTTTSNDQLYSSVAGLSGGGFVVTWMSEKQEGASKGFDIYAQRYSSNGTAQGSQFHVNTVSDNDQGYPSVAGLSNGGFIISWMSDKQEGASNAMGVYAQRYNSNGTPESEGEIHVNTYTAGDQRYPSVTGRNDGGFVVTWSGEGTGSVTGVYARIYKGNTAPVAANVSVTTNEDQSVAVTLTATDADGNPLTYTLVSIPAHGILSGTAPNLTYAPNSNWNGTDTFTFKANDGAVDSNIATVTITVAAVNDVPLAYNLNVTTNEDIALGGQLSATDVEPGTLTFALVGQAANGTAVVNANGTFTYTPNENWNGTDTFTFKATDSQGGVSIPAMVTITVVAVNDIPVANDLNVTTNEDVAVNGQLSATDVEPGTRTFALATPAANGVAVVNANGTFTYTPNANFNGSDTFTFKATDSQGGVSIPATVTITVVAVNDAPVAHDLTVTTNEDVAVSDQLTATDVDVAVSGQLAATIVQPGTLTFALVGQAANGTAVVNANGTFTYTPNANFNGSDSFTFKANDGSLDSNAATVSITIGAVNDAPQAHDLSATTNEDEAVSGQLAATDVELDALSFSLVGQATNGIAVVNANGTFTYTPNANWNGSDSFTFKANDGSLASNIATVTIAVAAVNDAPQAHDLNASTNEDAVVNGQLAATDAEPGTRTFALMDQATNGIAVVNANGTFTYTPNTNWNGTDTFTFKANDGAVDSNIATVTITVAAVNDVPLAYNLNVTTNEDIALGGQLSATDVEPGTLTFALVGQAANGTAVVNANGTFTYAPNENWNGTDTFTFKANDGSLDSNTATVTITVVAVNDTPTIELRGQVPAKVAPGTLVAFLVQVNDVDLNQTLVVSLVGTPDNATLVATKTPGMYLFMWAPTTTQTGQIDFIIRVTDNGVPSLSSDLPVSILVEYTNPPPVLSGVTLTQLADEGSPVTLSGHVDYAGTGNVTLSVAWGDGASETKIVAGDFQLTHTFADNPAGLPTGQYAVNVKATSPGGHDSFATLTTIRNVAPSIAAPANQFVFAGLNRAFDLGTFADPGPDRPWDVTVSWGDGSPASQFLLNAIGTLGARSHRYEEAGSYTVTLSVTDKDGAIGGTTFTIAVYQPADVLVHGTEDQVASGTLPMAIGVADWTFQIANGTTNGSLVVNPDGTYSYAPNANWNGTDSFTYTATDSLGAVSQPATVTIQVVAVNDAPVVSSATASGVEDTAITGQLMGTDVEGNTLTFQAVSQPANGTVVVNSDGSFTYTPNANFNGTDSFTYKANDGSLDSNTATVSITVAAVNDAPVAHDLTLTTNEDIALGGQLAATDVESGTLTFALVGQATNGTVVVNANGTFTYTPNENWNGTDSFTFKANDGSLDSNTATITINVAAVNDVPVAHNLTVTTNEDVAVNGQLAATDVESGTLTFALVGQATNGTVVVNANGTFTYTPNANWNGTDTFTFKANDGSLDSNTATVSITVAAVNDAPVVSNLTVTTSEDAAVTGQLTATDVEGNTLTFALVGQAANGTVVVNANGAYTYTPNANWNGTDSFAYTATDSLGAVSQPATVTIQVAAVNDVPVGQNVAHATNEDTAITAPIPITDVDAEALTYSVATPPAYGNVVLAANGSFTYTPAENWSGTDGFRIRGTDPHGASATSTITVTVAEVNDAPVIGFKGLPTGATPELKTVEFTVVGSDADNLKLVYGLEGAPQGASINNMTGAFTWTPTEAQGPGTYTFAVTVMGGTIQSKAFITLTVSEVNQPPSLTRVLHF